MIGENWAAGCIAGRVGIVGTAAVVVVAGLLLAGVAEVLGADTVGAGVAGAGGIGVKRKRWTWPFGIAACMSC